MPEPAENLPPNHSEAWRRVILEAAKRREIEDRVREMRQRVARLAKRDAPEIKSDEMDEAAD